MKNKDFAVILTGGKQYIVHEADTLVIDKLPGKKGDQVSFDKVLLFVDDKMNIQLGRPYLNKAIVKAQILTQGKGQKIRVARFRAKSRYRKVRGFRPELTEVKITAIKA